MRLGSRRQRGIAFGLMALLLLLVIAACGSNESAVEKAIAAAYRAQHGADVSRSVIDDLKPTLRGAKTSLDSTASDVSDSDREAFKNAVCTALKTWNNGGALDWNQIAANFGISSRAYEVQQATQELHRKIDEGASDQDVAITAFLDYGCSLDAG